MYLHQKTKTNKAKNKIIINFHKDIAFHLCKNVKNSKNIELYFNPMSAFTQISNSLKSLPE